mgnify:CR=1 FL=1
MTHIDGGLRSGCAGDGSCGAPAPTWDTSTGYHIRDSFIQFPKLLNEIRLSVNSG